MIGYSLFISHAEADKEIVKRLVDDLFIGSLDIKQREIFCTSIEGLNIDSGEDWKTKIKSSLLNSKIIICLITPNYKSSEMCLLEMGAAWISSSFVMPIVVDPISFSNLGPIYVDKQAIKLSKTVGLDNMRDKIIDILDIDPKSLKTGRWTEKKRDFRHWLKAFLYDNPFPLPVTKEELVSLSKRCEEYESKIEEVNNENIALEKEIEDQQGYITDLESAKDKATVQKIKRSRGISKTDMWEDFNGLLERVKKVIEEFKPPVRTKIYSCYSGNNLEILDYDYSSIDEAIADGVLDEDSSVNKYSKQIMRAEKELKALEEFMDSGITPDFLEEFDEKYPKAEFDIKNKLFWENVLKIKMSYDK